MRLYFAAPLFNANELAFNARMTEAIEQLGYDVFLPQRDGLELLSELEGAENDVIAPAIFELDRDNVLACDVLLCILDGRVPDEGVAVELGLGYADRIHHKPDRRLIGFVTQNWPFWGEFMNPMLTEAIDEMYHDEELLLDRLRAIADAA